MSLRRPLPISLSIRPSQAVLFAPAGLLILTALILARNFCSRPAVHAKDFPGQEGEVVIYLEYPPAYPFTGEVQAVLEVRRLPGREAVLKKTIGSRRWASELIEQFNIIEWPEPGLIVLYSRDGSLSQNVSVRPLGSPESDSDRPGGREP